MDKSEIRKLGKAKRASVQGEERQQYEQRICQQIRACAAYKEAMPIFCAFAHCGR